MKHLLIAASLFVATAASHAEGEWTALFDGKTLNGWTALTGKIEGWTVEPNGVLHFSGKGPYLINDKDYTSFELEWEWKLAEGGNNGIKYWVTQIGKEWLGENLDEVGPGSEQRVIDRD